MPYKFGEYVSTYVDPQSVKISETLRDRFMQNFQANDQLAMAVDQMQAALPFENDVVRKKEIQRQLEENLGKLAEQGDYENLGFAVHRASKDFAKAYAPIKENYTRYQSELAGLKERYEKGDINSEQYALSAGYITKGYKGFETDETGTKVKEGTMFSAPTIVKDPKLMDLVKERLEILHPEKYGNKIKRVNWAEGEAGAIEVQTGSTVETISPESIREVLEAVYQEPDVRAYIDQLADMKAVNAVGKNGDFQTVIGTQANAYQEAINKLTEQMSTGNFTKSDKATMQLQINKYQEELNQLGTIGDENTAHQYLKGKYKEALLAPVTQYGLKKAYRSVEQEHIESWSAKYLADREAKIASGGDLTVIGDVTASDTYGSNFTAKIDNYKNAYAEMTRQQEIMNQPNLSQQSKDEARQKVISYRAQMDEIRAQIVRAGDRAFSVDDLKKADPKVVDALQKLYPWAGAGELYMKLTETFDNNKDQDYMDFQKVYTEMHGGEFKRNTMQGLTIGGGSVIGAPSGGVPGGKEDLSLIPAAFNGFRDKINQNFGETKVATPFEYGVIPAATVQEGVIIRKSIDQYFVGKPLRASDQVTEVTEDGVEQKVGSDYEDYKVSSVGYDPTSKIFEINMVDSKGKNAKTVKMDGRRITSSSIEALNTPENRLAGAIYAINLGAKPGELSRRTIFINADENGVLVQKPYTLTVEAGDTYGDSYLTITDVNGNPFGTAGPNSASVVIGKDANGKDIVAPKKMKMNEPYMKQLVNAVGKDPSKANFGLPLVEF
jgi:hypothetical protein